MERIGNAGAGFRSITENIGGRRKKRDVAKRTEIADSVLSGRTSGADRTRLHWVSQPTVSRIVAAHLADRA